MDRLTPQQRHTVMSHIRSTDTQPEWRVRRMVFAMGFRYRLHAKALPGRPDLVFPRQRKAIFVHGCFWHRHGCRHGGRLPATRRAFWAEKLVRNHARDQKVLRQLWQAGWRVLVVWECETGDPERLRARLADFLAAPARPVNYDLDDQHALYGLVAETNLEPLG